MNDQQKAFLAMALGSALMLLASRAHAAPGGPRAQQGRIDAPGELGSRVAAGARRLEGGVDAVAHAGGTVSIFRNNFRKTR